METDFNVTDQTVGDNLLGHREIDQTHNWYSSHALYPDIKKNLVHIEKFKENQKLGNDRNLFFTTDQTHIIACILHAMKTDSPQRYFIVMGGAGTGKSVIIHELTEILGKDHVLVLAPTGVAANLINGKTIHSALRLNGCNFLRGRLLLQFQEQMKDIQIVIIDEFSMVGLSMLGKIDQRLREANTSNQNVVFGGYFLLMCGDYNQLQPVCDIPMYAEPRSGSAFAARGKLAYLAFTKVFILKTTQRLKGDDQRNFKKTLTHIANGTVTANDYNFLSKRFLSENLHLTNRFKNAIRLMARNKDVENYNYTMLAKIGRPVTILKAEHNNRTAENAKCDEANCLLPLLPLCIGARVMLRSQSFTPLGLCNGALGTVRDIIYETPPTLTGNIVPSELPLCILVDFDNYMGPKLYNGAFPVIPFQAFFMKNSINCSRKQIPLELAYAISIHRSQGLTLNKAVVDIGTSEFALGITYVASSRVRNINGLLYDPNFSRERFLKINTKKGTCAKRAELLRLESLQ